jgi:hypothetical protein
MGFIILWGFGFHDKGKNLFSNCINFLMVLGCATVTEKNGARKIISSDPSGSDFFWGLSPDKLYIGATKTPYSTSSYRSECPPIVIK